MCINFSKMNDSTRELYEYLWGNSENLPTKELCRTWVKKDKVESLNSYSFSIPGLLNKDIVVKGNPKKTEDNKSLVCAHLINIFNIQNEKTFKEKFFEVCSGSGGESAKITTLHSSSLCALLFFYNIKEHHLNLRITPEEIIEFDDVMFEFKNDVTSFGGPSNMDVVLISNNQRKILFLESKFSEYLNPGISDAISCTYLDEFGNEFYNTDFLKTIGLKFHINKKTNTNIFVNKDKKYFKIRSVDPTKETYASGIKQMISHFIAVRNFISKGGAKDETRILNKDYKIYLGEILFNFEYKSAQDYIALYTRNYELLSAQLNNTKADFTVLPENLFYSSLKEYCEPTIRKYYFGE